MDFALSDEQQAIQETARRFTTDRVAPGYQQREKDGVLDRALVREMGEIGLIGADLPEAFGGLGAGSVTAGIIAEEIAHGDISASYIQLLASLMGWMISTHAREEVAREVVPRMCTGEIVVGLGLTEPRGGSDAAHLQFKARRDGDRYILNGEKTSISMATQADQILLLARTGEADDGARGVSAFLAPLDAPGVTRTSFDDLGSVAVGRGSVFFDDVEVPASHLLGEEGGGFRQVMQGFDYSRALIGLQVLGSAAASLAETWDFITEREAFGNPIAKYQGVTGPLAEAETMLTAARLLCYKTLWLRDNDLPHTAEAAMCKWWAPQAAFDIIQRCLITHGHSGYSKDLPHQQRLRDVLGLQIGDGTEQIQKMIIAREKIGRIAVPY